MKATFLFLCAIASTAAAAAAPPAAEPFAVQFDITVAPKQRASFTIDVFPAWAPLGAARFRELATADGGAFFKGVRFFRTIAGFMTQFGIAAKPAVAARWKEAKLADDGSQPGVSNTPGHITFATSGKDSRTTQMFINLGSNANLDGMGFTPFGLVREPAEEGGGGGEGGGMAAVRTIYDGYGEGAPSGKGPEQGRIQAEGNKYLKRSFPRLSYVNGVTVVPADAAAVEKAAAAVAAGGGKKEL